MNENRSSRRKFIKQASLTAIVSGVSTLPLVAAPQVKAEVPKGLKVLFQGDSITDGNRGRTSDPNHIMGHGYAFAASSRIGADFPEAGFQFYNKGISGNKITDLEKRWQADALDIKPDVLSILVGINDTAAVINKNAEALPLKEFEEAYRRVLQQSRAANGELLIVLGLPFVYAVGKRKDDFEAWNTDVLQKAEVVRRLSVEFDALLVDYPAVFNKAIKNAPADYWIWDGIHPTIFGHELMAREWIRQLGRKWPFLAKKYKY